MNWVVNNVNWLINILTSCVVLCSMYRASPQSTSAQSNLASVLFFKEYNNSQVLSLREVSLNSNLYILIVLDFIVHDLSLIHI